ncbi:hypothetical protein FQR65_LT17674 [Abscondita terminalis]|nr:hypothetical protein FQR65_LT17674 [Abscondita terminalis]
MTTQTTSTPNHPYQTRGLTNRPNVSTIFLPLTLRSPSPERPIAEIITVDNNIQTTMANANLTLQNAIATEQTPILPKFQAPEPFIPGETNPHTFIKNFNRSANSNHWSAINKINFVDKKKRDIKISLANDVTLTTNNVLSVIVNAEENNCLVLDDNNSLKFRPMPELFNKKSVIVSKNPYFLNNQLHVDLELLVRDREKLFEKTTVGLSLITTIRASPVQITTGAYWKTLPDVIAYSATIPLTYSTSWTNELVEFIQSDQDADSCQEQDHTCKISSETEKLNRLLSLELKRTHEAVDTEFLHVSNDRTVKRHPRVLEFIGDFFSCYEEMQIFLKQLRSGLEDSLTQISNNSRIFLEYHDNVEDNLKEIKHKITNIQHYETEYRNKIRKSLNRNELQLKQTVMHVYDIVLHMLNLGRVMNRMEILATCKDHKIPPLIVTPQTLRTDLQNLSIELRKNGHSLAIPIDELSRYYKLSITDCTTTGNQLP